MSDEVHLTVNPKPVPLADDDTTPNFTVKGVRILVQENKYEFSTTGDYAKPDTECWFSIKINFPEYRSGTGGDDDDIVITNGEVYYLANHSLVSKQRRKKRIHLNKPARELLERHIIEFVGGMK